MKATSKIIKISILAIFYLTIFINDNFAADKITPEKILEKADNIRNPKNSFIMEVEVISYAEKDTSVFEVFTKGKELTAIKTISPRMNKGRNLLMLEENMWAYIPNLKRAVRISLSQKLSGQAANGDISRMRWSGDYKATIEKEDAKSWTLFLTATKKGLTYDKIRATVEKKSFRPLQAEYLTVQGKVLKNAIFKNYKQLAGEVRPNTIEIIDSLDKNDKSTINILKMETKEISSSTFDKDNLGNI